MSTSHVTRPPEPGHWLDLLVVGALAVLLWVVVGVPTRPLEPDAVSRLFIAEDWLRHPELISSGVWGSLHTYLLAASLSVFEDRLVAARALSFGSVLGIALLLQAIGRWRGDRWVGLGAAALWLLSPLALRLIDDGVSEPIFVLCVIGSMAALWWTFEWSSRAPTRAVAAAALAGVLWSLACAVRYEAWALLPVVALMCWPAGWRPMLAFTAFGFVYPAFWMVGNAMVHGDALYGIHANRDWVVLAEGYVPGGTPLRLVRKALFLPYGLLLGFGVLTSLMLLVSVPRTWRSSAYGRMVVATLLALAGLIVSQGTFGYLLHRSRYLLLVYALGLLVITLDPRWSERWRSFGTGRGLAAVLLLAASTLGFTALAARVPNPLQLETEQYVLLEPELPQVLELSRTVRQRLAPGEFLVVDFWAWAPTHSVLLRGSERNGYVAMLPGGRLEVPDIARLREQACLRGSGLVLVSNGSRFDRMAPIDTAAGKLFGLPATLEPITLPAASADAFRLVHFKLAPGVCPADAATKPWIGPRPVPSVPALNPSLQPLPEGFDDAASAPAN